MKPKLLILLLVTVSCAVRAQSQSDFEEYRRSLLNNYDRERKEIHHRFRSFRDSINSEYADFLRRPWKEKKVLPPVEKPKENPPVPPTIYQKEKPRKEPVNIEVAPAPTPTLPDSPGPLAPVEENNKSIGRCDFDFYGLRPTVRVPQKISRIIQASPESVANDWEEMSDGRFDNTLKDLLELKKEHHLSDWAYLQLIQKFAKSFTSAVNYEALLTAWLLSQSGYQIRIGSQNSEIVVLYGSHHTLFGNPYFTIEGLKYYPLNQDCETIRVSNARFEGEKPISLIINEEQKFGEHPTKERKIVGTKNPRLSPTVKVNQHLLDFYTTYPASSLDDNPLSQWAIYADSPFAESCKKELYPVFQNQLHGKNELSAVSDILNWVQTGFEYEYDEKVWGHDRIFFSEETLHYPYADCEDRSILFSRLVRDLLGLDVALISYPGHLAAAVAFNEPVSGDAITIDGRRYVICDPTYIGAPVGLQMPGLEYDRIEGILLKK